MIYIWRVRSEILISSRQKLQWLTSPAEFFGWSQYLLILRFLKVALLLEIANVTYPQNTLYLPNLTFCQDFLWKNSYLVSILRENHCYRQLSAQLHIVSLFINISDISRHRSSPKYIYSIFGLASVSKKPHLSWFLSAKVAYNWNSRFLWLLDLCKYNSKVSMAITFISLSVGSYWLIVSRN